MRKHRGQINEIRDLLWENDRNPLTVESLVFGDEEMNPDELNSPGFDGGKDYDFKVDANGNTIMNGDVKGILDKMRVMCLQGMTKLSNTPQAPEYDILKKIFNLIDKTVEVKDNSQNKN